MSSQDYILHTLAMLKANGMTKASLTSEDTAEFILRTIMSSKFRKYGASPEYQQHVRSAIAVNIAQKEPIKIAFVFGGYKLWRLEESPEVDWAELFSITYYTNWVRAIAAHYPPGVWFDFYSDDVIVELIDNIPQNDITAYLTSFRKLLAWFKDYLPHNVRFTLNRVAEQYNSYDEFRKELLEKFDQVHIDTLNEKQIATLRLNVKPVDDQPLDWIRIQRLHDAYARMDKRRPYYKTPDKIMAITGKHASAIAIGTTKTSIAKFWAGVGALQEVNGEYQEYVLSPSQMENTPFHWEDISIPGLEGKNFHRIRIMGPRRSITSEAVPVDGLTR